MESNVGELIMGKSFRDGRKFGKYLDVKSKKKHTKSRSNKELQHLEDNFEDTHNSIIEAWPNHSYNPTHDDQSDY